MSVYVRLNTRSQEMEKLEGARLLLSDIVLSPRGTDRYHLE